MWFYLPFDFVCTKNRAGQETPGGMRNTETPVVFLVSIAIKPYMLFLLYRQLDRIMPYNICGSSKFIFGLLVIFQYVAHICQTTLCGLLIWVAWLCRVLGGTDMDMWILFLSEKQRAHATTTTTKIYGCLTNCVVGRGLLLADIWSCDPSLF